MPEIGFWDSPEFIASSYKLQVTHPPGAPFYTILARVIIALAPSSSVALVSNLISVVFGGLAIKMLFHIVSFVSFELRNDKLTRDNCFGIEHVAGIVAAFSFAFCHSFWTVSTETEVYTLSFFALNLTLWIGLNWSVAGEKEADRLLVLICFLLGISIGVHMINLSVVIPLALLYGFTKYSHTWKTLILSSIAGVGTFVVLFMALFQGFLTFITKFDMLTVNSFGLPLNIGIYGAYTFLLAVLFGLMVFYPNNKLKIRSVLLPGLLMFVIGWSPYALALIRANANTPTSHGVIGSANLTEYIRAEQFGMGNVPLLKGPVFNAPLDQKAQFTDGPSIHVYDTDKRKYVRTNNGKYTKPNYAKEFDILFPRVYHRSTINKSWYNQWVTMRGQDVFYDINGKTEKFSKPTMLENLKFFTNYQVNWLNMRYLLWNFVGRQNDNKGTGLISNGNWITGIDILDAPRIGKLDKMPSRYGKNLSKDSFWLLPFLLGLIGACFLFYRSKKYFLFSAFVFLTFGLGITIYVNPLPESILIRERDYIFMGASMVFAMCIGVSSVLFYERFVFLKNERVRVFFIGISLLLASPLQLLAKGWDDHYRADYSFPRQLAKAYLDACPNQAVFVTVGDNMTFPLWYMQEVEGYRTDVRVVNYDFLWLDWYVNRLKCKINDSEPLEIQLPKKAYVKGAEKYWPLQPKTQNPVEVRELLKFISSDETTVLWNMRPTNYMPTDVFQFQFDSLAIQNSRLDTTKMNVRYSPTLTWQYRKDFYGHNDVILLDIIANNLEKRPICFAVNGKSNHKLGLEPFMVHRGLTEQLMPLIPDSSKINPKMVDTKTMYDYLMQQVDFSGLANKYGYVDYENETISREVLRRNYYFLGQALLEEGDTSQAVAVITRAEQVFPDSLVEYKQYAFSLGKLYSRAGLKEESERLMLTCIHNVKSEIEWFISVDPVHPIINVRYADELMEMYRQEVEQAAAIHSQLANDLRTELKTINTQYEAWRTVNWPY